MTLCVGDIKIRCLLFVLNHTTGIRFLVDSGAQISIIPVIGADKNKGPHEFTLQTVNKSLIKTYDQKCLTLDLGLRRALIHIFVIADVEKVIFGADFLYKYRLYVDINRHCLTDDVTYVKSSESVRKGFFLSPSVANIEENPIFCKLFKKFANITKPSFH